MYFDSHIAKALQPGQHLVVEGCPGLRLEVSKTRKTWTYRYKDDAGRMKQMALGQWPAVTAHMAESRWLDLRRQRGEGVDPKQKKLQEQRALKAETERVTFTVRKLVQGYIDGHLKVARKKSGADAGARTLLNLLASNPEFATMPARNVTRSTAFDLLDAKKARPTAAAGIRSMLAGAWDYALDAGKLDDDVPNWWRSVMKKRLVSKGKFVGGKHLGRQRRTLRAEELHTLLAWLPNMHDIGRDAVQLYLWTATRGAEILAMRPEYISQEADGWWWTIPKASTKNARFDDAVDHRVPLIGRALEIVKRRIVEVGESGYLFEGLRGGQYQQANLSEYIYSLQPYSKKLSRRKYKFKVIPVTHWTPHDLRRTSRTLLASLGCPNEIGEAIVDHMPDGEVATYNAYTYDKERREWLGKLATYLEVVALPAVLPALP